VSTDKTKTCIALIALLIYVFTFVLYCYAEKIRTVEGLIEDVSSNSIKVRGKYYNISDAPLKNASGKNLSKDQLKLGKKVDIFFQGNKITTVIIYEYMVE
jgi:hypothetical protein